MSIVASGGVYPTREREKVVLVPGAYAMLEMHRVHFLLVHCKSVASML